MSKNFMAVPGIYNGGLLDVSSKYDENIFFCLQNYTFSHYQCGTKIWFYFIFHSAILSDIISKQSTLDALAAEVILKQVCAVLT